MPREYNISWNAAQRSRLDSATRKYNNALRRAARQYPDNAQFLPAQASYKELKQSITTARALNNTVNRLLRATRPGALDLVQQADKSIITAYERKEFAILRSVRERQKAMRARQLGVQQPKAGRAGTLTQASLSPDKRPVAGFSAGALRRFIQTQERKINMSNVEKAQRYFRNYTSALQSVFGGFSEFDPQIEYIEDAIINLAGRDFDALRTAIDEAPGIDYIYEPLEREAKLQKIVDYWNGVEEYAKIKAVRDVVPRYGRAIRRADLVEG